MPLDADLLPRIEPLYGASFAQLLAGEVRSPAAVPTPVEGVSSRDTTLPGPHGDIPVRIYTPDRATDEVLPALVWNHGGAWMFGDLDMPEADAVARRVARDVPAVVVSVDYRLAPAHCYPIPLDDVVAAFNAVVADADTLGIAAERVAIGGASAGGNLAAGAAQVLRDADGPRPAALFLGYPATDPVNGPYPDARPEECPLVMWLDGPIVSGLFATYLGPDGATAGAPAVPAAGNLTGLPPTLVTTAEYDALTPQAAQFVEHLRGAGVAVTHHDERGLLHGYLNMVGDLPAADAALGRHSAWLRQVLSK